mmetsp:Transcript_2492/g.3670  ORF Transcript_2492/g.3670 Transcript_2492/m.3670 type:complete len:338 (+) Transcript_2492:85-1098(+)
MKLSVSVYLIICSAEAFNALSSIGNGRTSLMSLHGHSEADALLEKVARMRQEIAEMEGKTIEQVEEEAREKKNVAEEAKKVLEKPTESRQTQSQVRIPIPESPDQMIEQAAQAVERAYRDGVNRQTVRFALVRDDEVNMANLEQWPGGAQEMYRESAKPLTMEMMKQIFSEPYARSDVTAKDVWDFDGSAIMTAEKSNATALIFANTDVKYTKDIKNLDEELGDKLLLLINPFWRNLDSWGINLLSPGAKDLARQVIFETGYPETYSFIRIPVKGKTCAAIKSYPYDWQIFAYLEDGAGWERPIWLGSTESEPTGSEITDLLVERPEYIESWKKRFM